MSIDLKMKYFAFISIVTLSVSLPTNEPSHSIFIRPDISNHNILGNVAPSFNLTPPKRKHEKGPGIIIPGIQVNKESSYPPSITTIEPRLKNLPEEEHDYPTDKEDEHHFHLDHNHRE